jgi:hypothetical protein
VSTINILIRSKGLKAVKEVEIFWFELCTCRQIPTFRWDILPPSSGLKTNIDSTYGMCLRETYGLFISILFINRNAVVKLRDSQCFVSARRVSLRSCPLFCFVLILKTWTCVSNWYEKPVRQVQSSTPCPLLPFLAELVSWVVCGTGLTLCAKILFPNTCKPSSKLAFET